MPISVTCPCSKKFRVPDELAGRTVRCPGCSQPLRIPGQLGAAPTVAVGANPPAAPQANQTRPFPVLGKCIGLTAVIVGFLFVAGAIFLLASSDAKPVAVLIVFGTPAILWVLFGGLLLGLQRRFVTPFWVFLVANMLLGVLCTTQARSFGSSRDAQFFGYLGLGLIIGTLVLQLFHALLVRDIRREAAAKNAG